MPFQTEKYAAGLLGLLPRVLLLFLLILLLEVSEAALVIYMLLKSGQILQETHVRHTEERST